MKAGMKPSEQNDVIHCHQLTKRFPGGILAVDHLDLSVHRGEIFGLLGPNGAVKTTTVGMITTMVIPTAGEVSVAGIDVLAHPALIKQLIGVVAQSNNLDRALNVWENLYYHGLFFGMGRSRSRAAANQSLADFRLKERASADIAEISGGMARRLQVARALMHRPLVLFLDEPTTGLDPQSRLALWQILRRLRSEGQAILLTTHNMEEADALCDRLAILDHGCILAQGNPKQLKESVGASSVISLSTSADIQALIDRLKESLPEIVKAEKVGGRAQLHIKGTARIIPRIVETAEAAGFPITDLSISEPTLETVFINLTGKELRE